MAADVTKYREAAARLEESEAKYRAMYDSSADAIMLLDPKKSFIAGNPATVKLFSCIDEEEFISHSPASLSPEYQPNGGRSDAEAQKMMDLAIRNGIHSFDWVHKKVGGTEFSARVLLSRIRLGGSVLLQATVRDTSLEKELQTELERQIASLERFQKITVDRELKMKELKRRIAELESSKSDGK
jgi:PAS domain S-box-containing protein